MSLITSSPPALPPRRTTTSKALEAKIGEEEEEAVDSTIYLNSETQQISLYADFPILPKEQIRVLKLLPGELQDEVCCELVVQDVDLVTERRPPSNIQRDMIGDMLNLSFTDFVRKNVTKAQFVQDVRKWLPKSYQERHQQQLTEAHIATSALPTFNALSYTWGSWVDSMTIRINDRVDFPVTRNLWSALRRLRHATDTLPLWVDQICINQQDEGEKALQVQAMSNIYSLAWDVVIWLGDVPDDALPPEQTAGRVGRRKIAEQLLQAMNAAAPTWWTRTWCIQEFMMARQDPLTCFGACQMRWTEMSQLGKQVKDDRNLHWSTFRDDWNQDSHERERDPLDDVSVPFYSFQRIRYMASGRSLATMGWAYSQTQATDPRDKVYSLLGLIDPAERALITIDYKRPVPWVFAEATYASIVASGNLNILHLVKQDRSALSLPSWVVDFSYAGKAIKEDWVGTQDFSQYLFDEVPLPWCRLQDRSTAKAILTVRRHSLVLAGLHFDTIVHTYRRRTRAKYWGELTQTFKDLLKAPSGLFSDQPAMLTKNEQAIFQLVLDIAEGGSPYTNLARRDTSGSQENDSEETWSENEDEEKVMMLSFRLFDVWSRKFLRGHVSGLSKVAWRQYGLWKLYFRHLCHGDTFYITSKGFIGLGHKDCRIGDTVALPFGSRHPILLRPDREGKRYDFLGFSYVNGIMNDELSNVAAGLLLCEMQFVLN